MVVRYDGDFNVELNVKSEWYIKRKKNYNFQRNNRMIIDKELP